MIATVQELVQGENLSHMMSAGWRPTELDVAHIASEVLAVLGYLHQHHVSMTLQPPCNLQPLSSLHACDTYHADSNCMHTHMPWKTLHCYKHSQVSLSDTVCALRQPEYLTLHIALSKIDTGASHAKYS